MPAALRTAIRIHYGKCQLAPKQRINIDSDVWPTGRQANSWLVVPAQTVDATPPNQLIRQYFPWRTDLFGCARSKPSQGSVPADLT